MISSQFEEYCIEISGNCSKYKVEHNNIYKLLWAVDFSISAINIVVGAIVASTSFLILIVSNIAVIGNIILGILSLTSTILLTLAKYFKLEEKYTKHHIASIEYHKLYSDIKTLNSESADNISRIKAKYLKLIEEYPPIRFK